MKSMEMEKSKTSHDSDSEKRVAKVHVEEISDMLVKATVDSMPVQPERLTSIEGPLFEVTKVDDHTADVKIIHGFRAHFRPKKQLNRANENFENCLVPAPSAKVRNRVLRRGSLSFSDLTVFGDSNSGKGLLMDSSCPWQIDPQDIKLGRRIAVGGFAEVYIAHYQGSVVAVKRSFDRDASAFEEFRHEVSLVARLRHPNLILFMGYCCTPEFSIIYEFMPKGSLYDILRSHDDEPLEDSYTEIVLVSVARGMNYLHTRTPPILHLDLKSPNILIDNAWRVKITDFGLSRLRSRTLVSGNHGANGTPHWMAPEAIRGEKVNEKTDVYSFGVVIWELLTGRVPWSHLNAIQVIAAVGFKDKQLPQPDHPDQWLLSLMERCLHHDPEQRPSFQEILEALDHHYTHDGLGNKLPTPLGLKAKGERALTQEDEPSTPIGTLVEIPDGQLFRISTEAEDHLEDSTHMRSVKKLEEFEESFKSEITPPQQISPFSEFACVPILDQDSTSETQPEEDLSSSTLSGVPDRQISPFAAFASEPFIPFSSEASSSQDYGGSSRYNFNYQQDSSSHNVDSGNTNYPGNGGSTQDGVSDCCGVMMESNQSCTSVLRFEQKRQMSLLYHTMETRSRDNTSMLDDNTFLQLGIEPLTPSPDTMANSPHPEPETSFFQSINQEENNGWKIKVAEVEAEDEQPTLAEDFRQNSGSNTDESEEEWTFKEDEFDQESESVLVESQRGGLIPPLSFIFKKGVTDD